MFSPETVIGWLAAYRYFILFPLTTIEGPIVTILAGFLASLGYFGVVPAIIVVTFGDLTGDAIHYAAGRWGRRKFLDYWGKYFGITADKVSRFEERFKRHGIKTLAAGKLAQGIGGIPLVAAGAAKMPFIDFILVNLALTIPKSLVLFLVGYYFGQAYAKINSYLEIASLVFIGAAIVVFAIYFFYWPRKNKTGNQ